MDDVLTRATEVIVTHARLLERLSFRSRFEGAPAAAVEQAVRAYSNPDGGLGHALEPDSPLRAGFSDATLEAHLDDLLRRQEGDGGWPVPWQPPGPAAYCEWRAHITSEAINVLDAYEMIHRSP
jgi:hypothetical protein